MRHPRTCDITGEGMSEGFYLEHDLRKNYIKYESDLLVHLVNYCNLDLNTDGFTNQEILDEYYHEEYYIWTTWEDDY
jgi:hypothetical protein